MKTVLALFALIAYVSAASLEAEVVQRMFDDWKVTYNKVYSNELEHKYRLAVFRSNANFVHNHDAERLGFTVGLNEFADLTNQEFVAIFTGMNITAQPTGRLTGVPLSATAPASWDWRSHGAVTPVKNQGQCGSCWSFSATGAMEGAHFLAKKQLVSLSEQNLVDCSVPQGNMGCNGGLMDSAFRYVISNKGIDTEASYPYTATGPNSCKFNRANVGATISSYKDIPQGSETALLNALEKQPISVAIDASHSSFQLYRSGVYNEPSCSSVRLDHGVLAVGWGSLGGADYWLVKNSWGTSWGQQGYIMMSRNRNNQCGIATASSYPVV